MLQSSLCYFSDEYILPKATITVAEATAAAQNNVDEEVVFKNCAPFTPFTNYKGYDLSAQAKET